VKYALTGATGFVGSHLLTLLRAAGHEVVAVVRDPGRASHLDAHLMAGDVTAYSSLVEAFRGVDGVFHVAGWYKLGADDPAQGWAVNVQGTRNALAAAAECGVARVVYTSTLAVNSDTRGRTVDETYRFTGRHLSVYDHTKAEAHRLAHRATGVEVVTVMPGGIYGPGDTSQVGDLIRRTAQGHRVQAPAGLRMCMAHVDDIADGHLRAMERGRDGEDYMLAGPQTTVVEVLRLVADLAGTKPPLVLPDAVVGVSAAVMGVVERGVRVPATYRAESLRAARASYLGTADKAAAELGWFARDLPTGLAETVEWDLAH
jgi:dihydroflavonol-4-reductase